MFKKKDLKIFGLTDKENIILKALQEESASVSLLAKKVAEPRTTVAFLLRKLQERGLVEKVKICSVCLQKNLRVLHRLLLNKEN